MRRYLLPALLVIPTPLTAQPIGECGFDRESLSFAGTRTEQATCLLRKVRLLGEREPQPLPPVIRSLMERDDGPDATQREAALSALPDPYQAYARRYSDLPISQTASGLPALYFVIHDTSEPFMGDAPFPRYLDRDLRVNAFGPYMDKTFGEKPVAHIFLNRAGQIWAGHDFSEGWRATKLESRVIGPAARGRMVHIETVQPRRFIKGSTDRSHTLGPVPGFSRAQYRMLAALYVYASARAGRWLIPAQHATVDATLPDAHDDPQNFELDAFAGELERLVNPPRKAR